MCPPAMKLKVSAFHLVITYLDIFLTIQIIFLFLALKSLKYTASCDVYFHLFSMLSFLSENIPGYKTTVGN